MWPYKQVYCRMFPAQLGGRRRWGRQWMRWSPWRTAVEQRRPGSCPTPAPEWLALAGWGCDRGCEQDDKEEPPPVEVSPRRSGWAVAKLASVRAETHDGGTALPRRGDLPWMEPRPRGIGEFPPD